MEHFCSYCSVIVGSESELRAHCNSESHQLTIMSDEGRDWKYRAPARGVGADQYTLCPAYAATGKCRLGQQCCDAHGEEELFEWKERFDYRQTKLQRAKECSLQGRNYTEQLLEKWLTSTNPNLIMTENLDTVDITVEPEVNLTVSEKNCCREWTFHISAKATLRHIALLYETHRNHFRISQLRSGRSSDIKEFNLGLHCQEWSNFENVDFNEDSYTCKVRFVTAIYGTFRQVVVFDFGFEPVLIKKLCVDVVSVTDMEKLQQAGDTAVSFTDRWSSSDVTVIPFENRPYALGEQEECLLTCYPPPHGTKFTVTQSVMEPLLTKTNYASRQHELLCIEEMAQYELLSRFNVKAHLNLTQCYLLTPNSASTAKYAHNGELFANMQLSSVLSEDSAEGRLILTNCSTVLLAPEKTKGEEKRKVYEAIIEDKGKTVIYIRLSKRCTEDLNLKPDREFSAEVQFQLNRLPLCEMHFAVDRLYPPSLVFPEVAHPLDFPKHNSDMGFDVKLNPKQKEAVYAITLPLHHKLPPVLIIGPFGTGKTFTLAQAVKMILNDHGSRILVCTHSNSAADIYIREYLHPEVADGRVEATPLRIYYRHRWVATVHPTVQQYCLVSSGSDRSFNMPTIEDVKKHRVIVTTLSTSRYLVQLGLEKGFFTHILIDEAAQAMECEAVMPLSLANESTRIVLAGDHMQLSPEVYSQFAQQRNLHTSLLERLYDLYTEDFPCKILLCENYRSHEAIIKYTSELFYDNHLKASGQQPRHKKYYPLTFFTARGEDVQDCNSTAFHNNAEVYEIVERVIELKKNWPSNWGDQDETSIGVVTPYYDQVVRIRAELRKKKLHGVSVERVLNVQGKQFRVIFLSAVRTRQTCDSKSKSDIDLDHGFLSNARLLNTAITRAQSLVAVVGDPVSMCSVGKCRKLWEKFIHTCYKEKSLFGITWDSLRSQLDSMELKKNFILNPLAPEFVPGRMYHGQPNPVPNSETFCENAAPPQSWLVFPFTPLQGPPIIQPAVVPVSHMLSAPHPYNVVNCFCPSLITPGQPNPFQTYPYNSPPVQPAPPPPPPPPPAQRPTNVQSRMPSTVFPRKITSNRTMVMEHNVSTKEFEHGLPFNRQVKRNEPQPPPLNVMFRNAEERDEAKRQFFNRMENFLHVNGQNEEHPFQNGHVLYNNIDDKSNKQFNMMKPDEAFNPIFKNGMVNNEINNVNSFPDHAQIRTVKLPYNNAWLPFSPKSYPETEMQNIQNIPMNHTEDHGVRVPFHETNGIPNERERMRSVFNGIDMHPVLPPNHNPGIVGDKWVIVHDILQNLCRTETTNIQAFRSVFDEKMILLQKILPPGVNLMKFLDGDEQAKNFIQHLLATEGQLAVKTCLLLMTSIKRDQDTIEKFSNQSFSTPRSLPDPPVMLQRNVTASPFASPRPLLNNNSHMPEIMNNSETFPLNPASPYLQNHLFAMNKPEVNYFNNCEQNQELPRSLNQMANQAPWMGENNPNINGNIMLNRPVQELPLQAMSRLSMNNTHNEGRLPNGDVHEDIFSSDSFPNFPPDSFSHRHNTDVDRMNDPLKRIWMSSGEYKPSPNFHEQASSPFQLTDPGSTQGCYLSRLRGANNSHDNGENSQAFPFNFERSEERSPTRSRENNGHMTAGPLSMSYPDIPDILSSHLLPHSKEGPSKVKQKTQQSENSTNSPFMFELSLQSNNDSSIRFPQLSSEGMTYAKILRSPQQ